MIGVSKTKVFQADGVPIGDAVKDYAQDEGMVGSIDAIKGIAIALVVAFHCLGQSPLSFLFEYKFVQFYLPQYTPGISGLIPSVHSFKGLADAFVSVVGGLGYQGVHLFIIASGLGLTLSFFRKGMRLPGWYLRRAQRILPMYWANVALVVALSQGWHLFYYFAPPISLATIILQVLCLNVLVPNYFSGVNYPLWFVGLLVQLYLAFPFIMKLYDRWKPSAIFLFSILITGVVRLAGIYYINNFHPSFAVGALFLCRLAEFVFGISFAFHLVKSRQSWIGFLAGIGVPLYLCGMLLHLSKATTALSDTTIGISLFLILWSMVHSLPSLILKGLGFLGRHSLGIFLFHSLLIRPAYGLSHLVMDNKLLLFFSLVFITLISGAAIDAYLSTLQEATVGYFRRRLSRSNFSQSPG